ncbi:MAG: hypothetical protein JNL82_03335 [Myxococcales bacterium]|nr:hypothetical protein [Myxococcales bacterium]
MSDDADIRALVEQCKTIPAIRLYQERHGGTLTAARAAIEAMHWDLGQRRGAGSLERELDELVRRGDRIAAIKRYRDATGCGLKEASDYLAIRQPAPVAATPAPAAAPKPAPPPPAATTPAPATAPKPAPVATTPALPAAPKPAPPSPAAPPPAKPAIPLPAAPADPVDQAIRDGRMIEAIKLWRERTGVGLKAAKDAVEARKAQLAATTPGPAAAQAGFDAETDRLLRAGDKIAAIKRHRQLTGKPLKDCKEAVEARAAALGRAR